MYNRDICRENFNTCYCTMSFAGIVSQVNTLLDQLNVSNHISRVEDLNAATFVLLFEGLCGEELSGIDFYSNFQHLVTTMDSPLPCLSLTSDPITPSVPHTLIFLEAQLSESVR